MKFYQSICWICHKQFTFEYPRGRALCKSCYASYDFKEVRRWRGHILHARKNGLEDSLTFLQWLKTIEDFNGLCAYCQKTEYTAFEHFVPVKDGGGTTVSNCVPSCHKCNMHKRPDRWNMPLETFNRVKQYLEKRK